MAQWMPRDVALIIGGYAMEWTVLPWVEERAPKISKTRDESNMILHWHGELVEESNRITGTGITDLNGMRTMMIMHDDYAPVVPAEGDADPYDETADHYVWENPLCQDFVRGLTVDWIALAANPADWALDLMEQLKTSVPWYPWKNLCRNTNPRVRALWERGKESDLDWIWLATNPNAIDKLRTKCNEVFGYDAFIRWFILWNTGAENFIKIELKMDITKDANICYNSDPWPAARDAQDAIDIKTALQCGYGRNIQPHAIRRMQEFTEWTPRMRGYLYTNPSPLALAMIRDNPERFPLTPVIWSNPGIFELTIPKGLVEILLSL